jgi:hypothetical protein
MKFRTTGIALLIGGAFAFGGPSDAQPPTTNTTMTTAPGMALAVQTMRANATVVGLDAATRTVSLKGGSGITYDVIAGPNVRNFDQLKVGDAVMAEYIQALSLELKKRGTSSSTQATVDQGVARTKPGQKPGLAGDRQITALADVIAVDTDKHLVTLRGPRGNQVDLNVQDPEQLKNIEKGDQVEVVYTEAVAVVVAPAAEPAAK